MFNRFLAPVLCGALSLSSAAFATENSLLFDQPTYMVSVDYEVAPLDVTRSESTESADIFRAPEPRHPFAITLFDSEPVEDQAYLWAQTKLFFAFGGVAVGVLAVMPKSVTNWDDDIWTTAHKKWWSNVTHGPVWDKDDFVMNYVMHPYFGGVYYVAARESGYNQWNSFVYSFLMSTFYWEYGFESLAEIPSIQDLIITPVGGWLYGEWAYQRKRSIVANGGEVWGSSFLGDVVIGVLDPAGSIYQLINGEREKPVVEDVALQMTFTPPFPTHQRDSDSAEEEDEFFGFVLSFKM